MSLTNALTIRIAFLDVGQGDTLVISSPSTHEAIVVDCVDEKAVLEYLKREGVSHLRGIITTHLHNDHCGRVVKCLRGLGLFPEIGACEVLGFNPIFNRSLIGTLLQDADGHSADSEQGRSRSQETAFRNLLDWLNNGNNKRHYRLMLEEEGRAFPINGELAQHIRLIHPHAADLGSLETTGLNNTSVVVRVSNSGASALLAGDLEPAGWRKLQQNHGDVKSDVLKFPHHGGKWTEEDAQDLLSKAQPSIVVISVGTATMGGKQKTMSNMYGHPNPEVFRAIAKYSHDCKAIRVLCTQATSQCNSELLDTAKRSAIRTKLVEEFEQAARQILTPPNSRQGCPCAGTVIIELSDTARVLQPEMKFHQQVIIGQYYSQDHKCFIQ